MRLRPIKRVYIFVTRELKKVQKILKKDLEDRIK
jgi:hypothetical protein